MLPLVVVLPAGPVGCCQHCFREFQGATLPRSVHTVRLSGKARRHVMVCTGLTNPSAHTEGRLCSHSALPAQSSTSCVAVPLLLCTTSSFSVSCRTPTLPQRARHSAATAGTIRQSGQHPHVTDTPSDGNPKKIRKASRTAGYPNNLQTKPLLNILRRRCDGKAACQEMWAQPSSFCVAVVQVVTSADTTHVLNL
jgi:hypothetical protein